MTARFETATATATILFRRATESTDRITNNVVILHEWRIWKSLDAIRCRPNRFEAGQTARRFLSVKIVSVAVGLRRFRIDRQTRQGAGLIVDFRNCFTAAVRSHLPVKAFRVWV